MWINFLEMRFAVDNSMIFFDRVTKIYGNGQKALDNVSLKVGRGEFVFLEGDSGAGKTTMLELILKETDPTQGNIQVNGIELAGLRERQIYQYRRYIGMVFQDFRLFSDFTVYENVAFAQRVVEADYKTMKRRVMEVLNQVGLGSKAKYYPDQLSGGEKQRTAIARAIVNEPRVLLLDEPLGALDLKLRQDMQYELIRLKNELGITFIYVTHDQEEALTMSDTIVVMNQGYIQQMGSPEQIYNEPENAFVADFIGESNIVPGIMIKDELVEIFGARFVCVDKGFGNNRPVDVVIRPEDIDLVKPEEGSIQGVVTHLIFKGVHYEMEVTTPDGFEWLVHSTDMFPVGRQVGIHVEPFDIQIMNKPASEDEEALGVNE